MNLSIRNRLVLGFGVMLFLLAVVAGVGQIQLAKIQHLNTELDERAYRLSLASEWAMQVKIAVATKGGVPALDTEQVKKLRSWVRQVFLFKGFAPFHQLVGELLAGFPGIIQVVLSHSHYAQAGEEQFAAVIRDLFAGGFPGCFDFFSDDFDFSGHDMHQFLSRLSCY